MLHLVMCLPTTALVPVRNRALEVILSEVFSMLAACSVQSTGNRTGTASQLYHLLAQYVGDHVCADTGSLCGGGMSVSDSRRMLESNDAL